MNKKKLNLNFEQSILSHQLKHALRSKLQLNRIHESDCEVVKLAPRMFLSTSIDSFSDEWAVGLFQKPETLARICVHGTLSDLVVSGANPTGFLFSAQWGFKDSSDVKDIVFKTVVEELRKLKVPLLGGDEGQSAMMSLSGVAIGTSKTMPKTRMGIRPGQLLCTVGDFGIGPALGFQYLLGKAHNFIAEDQYRPRAYFDVSSGILQYAKASMDTSDGLCSTLATLAELNEVHFELNASSVEVNPLAREFCIKNNLPILALWFGEIGDYQPLFAVDEKDYLKAKRAIFGMRVIGKVLPKRQKSHVLAIKERKIDFSLDRFSKIPRSTLPEIRAVFQNMVNWLESEKITHV